MTALAAELQRLLLPKDPNDERNVFLEIRAGTGGDESALFAGDLFRMYTRYAERNRWQVEIVSESQSELGGYKEVIARIVGQRRLLEAQVRVGRPSRAARAGDRDAGPHPHVGVHGRGDARGRPDRRHRDQSGRHAHRHVPRVGRGRPARQQDRLRGAHHAPADRASSSSARTTARSTGTARRRWRCSRRACSTRSGSERQQKEAAHRKSLIGSGDRSERIRTYNFPQGRVTDHRINLTLYKIDAIMDGDLDELVDRARAGAPGRAARGAWRRNDMKTVAARAVARDAAPRVARVRRDRFRRALSPRPGSARHALHQRRQADRRARGRRGDAAHPAQLPRCYPGLGTWRASRRDTGAFIGWFTLKYIPKTVEVEVGYRLLHEAWGQGFATEGATELVRYGFDDLGLYRIIGLTHRDNVASQRVLQKAGLAGRLGPLLRPAAARVRSAESAARDRRRSRSRRALAQAAASFRSTRRCCSRTC